jgi:hypothetical protein
MKLIVVILPKFVVQISVPVEKIDACRIQKRLAREKSDPKSKIHKKEEINLSICLFEKRLLGQCWNHNSISIEMHFLAVTVDINELSFSHRPFLEKGPMENVGTLIRFL